MKNYYPIGTRFKIRLHSVNEVDEAPEENYKVVESSSNPRSGIISCETALGRALLQREKEYKGPKDGTVCAIEVLDIILPEYQNIDSSSLERLIETVLHELEAYSQAASIQRLVIVRRYIFRYRQLFDEDAFWAQLKDGSVFKEFFGKHPSLLNDYADDDVSEKEIKTAIKNKYVDIFSILDGYFSIPDKYEIEWSPCILFKGFSENDRMLAREWLNGETEDADLMAKMLSARGAEKAALRFYSSVGYAVEDISITQLDEITTDYQDYDILLDGNIYIDVKNARNPFGNRNRYINHCVPKIKQKRWKKEVVIAGVLSPYLQLRYIKDPCNISFKVYPIRFLGEVKIENIDKLTSEFSEENFLIIPTDREIIPPWLFDYPEKFYFYESTRIFKKSKLYEFSR